MTRPNVLVQLTTSRKVAEFRAGIGDAPGIIVVRQIGQPGESLRLTGVDAFYMSLTRAEQWGSRPIPEHTVAVLHTRPQEQEQGSPRFILSGFLLKEGDPNTPEFVIPLLVKALFNTIGEVNRATPGAIRTLGLFEYELSFRGSDLARIGRLLADSIATATRRFPCPCCGFRTLVEQPPGTFSICPVCFWEDDNVQYEQPTFRGGANEVSLIEARENFIRDGVSNERFRDRVRPPLSDES